MKNAIFLLASFVLLISCGQGSQKKKVETKADKQGKKVTENVEELRLKTKTGKEFVVETKSTSASLNDIVVSPKGFKNTKESFTVKDADPVVDVFTADLNKDGFDELYVVTMSAGSGSYATIYAWSSNRDKSVTPVHIRELPEKEEEEVFKGYMGHDSVYVAGDRLCRKFPVYKDGDANCCPSGGTKVVKYVLKQGEATWLLEVEKN